MKTINKYYAHFILLAVLLIAGIQTALNVHTAHGAMTDDEKNKIEQPYEPAIEEEEKPADIIPPITAIKVSETVKKIK